MAWELTTRLSQVLVKRVLAIPRVFLTDHFETDSLRSGKNSCSTITKIHKCHMEIGLQLGIAPLITSQDPVNVTATNKMAL